MNTPMVLDLAAIVNGFFMVVIIVSYSISMAYNIMFLARSNWAKFSPVKILMTIVCFPFVGIYIYQLAKLIHNVPLNVDILGTFFVRPSISFMGIALAVASITRFYALIHGGEKWTLRQRKIS